jgi:hypothetical protein
MEERQEHQCARVGMNVSLLCVTLGAAAPVIVMLKEFMQSLAGGPSARSGVKWAILVGIILTLIPLYLAAGLLGRLAGKIICQKRRGYGGAIFTGIVLALSCLATGALALAVVVGANSGSRDLLGMAALLLLGTGLYGFLPAILLGVLYGALVRWRLTKAGCLGGV